MSKEQCHFCEKEIEGNDIHIAECANYCVTSCSNPTCVDKASEAMERQQELDDWEEC